MSESDNWQVACTHISGVPGAKTIHLLGCTMIRSRQLVTSTTFAGGPARAVEAGTRRHCDYWSGCSVMEPMFFPFRTNDSAPTVNNRRHSWVRIGCRDDGKTPSFHFSAHPAGGPRD